MNNFNGKIFSALILIIFLDIFMIGEWRAAAESRVVFCDIGQGDGVFINLKGGTQIIADAGPDNNMVGCAGKYMPYFDRKIEYIIISHPDKDHFAGAMELLKRYDVGKVFWNGDLSAIPEYAEFLKMAGGRAEVAYTDSDFRAAGAKIDFLYPYVLDRETKNNNDNSLVFRFEYTPTSILPLSKGEEGRGISILFTGDLPATGEAELIKHNANLRADVLEVGHHGSRYSSSEEFLRAVRPKLAAISVGANNKYGHPAYIILKRLKNLGIKYLRTDEKGDIVINL